MCAVDVSTMYTYTMYTMCTSELSQTSIYIYIYIYIYVYNHMLLQT